MTITQRLTREPNLILGLVTAGLALLVLFGVHISDAQTAGIGLFLAALIALVRFVVTPAAEVVVQNTPDDETPPVAGPAATVATGTPVVVELHRLPGTS